MESLVINFFLYLAHNESYIICYITAQNPRFVKNLFLERFFVFGHADFGILKSIIFLGQNDEMV